jgi:tRNA dimethylallyltransferase
LCRTGRFQLQISSPNLEYSVSSVQRSPLLAILGPTAIGKSALAVELAQAFRGEIVSADSRQVYRYMDIGTAKPSPQQRSIVPHHLIDIISPDEDYSLALFLRQARALISGINKDRNALPVLVSGTGQYIWGLLEGWQVPEVSPDPQLRAKLEYRAETEGAARLYEELSRLDPDASYRIDPRNVRRVIRALEVFHSTRDRPRQHPRKVPPGYDTRIIGLTMEREALYRRIDERVDAMIAAGWVDEVRGLLERGYSPKLPALSSLGYSELVQYLDSKLALDEAIQRIKFRTHRFARQQYAWFRLRDPRIHWFDATARNYADAVKSRIQQWL